jgi:hypothetical protein
VIYKNKGRLHLLHVSVDCNQWAVELY